MEKLFSLNDIIYVSTKKYAPTLGAILELAVLSKDKESMHLVDQYEGRFIVNVWEDEEVRTYKTKNTKKFITFADLAIPHKNKITNAVEYTCTLPLPKSFGTTTSKFVFSKEQFENGINLKVLKQMNNNLLESQINFDKLIKKINAENFIKYEKKYREEIEKL